MQRRASIIATPAAALALAALLVVLGGAARGASAARPILSSSHAVLSLRNPLKATLADVSPHASASDDDGERVKGATALAGVDDAKGAGAAETRRRSLVEVAAEGLFDVFGFDVSATAVFDPLCEFVNPLLDEAHALNCGGDERRRRG